MNMQEMNKAELAFLEQATRQLLVQWARDQIIGRDLTGFSSPFKDFAITKGWVSANQPKVLAAGFMAAAAFLKR